MKTVRFLRSTNINRRSYRHGDVEALPDGQAKALARAGVVEIPGEPDPAPSADTRRYPGSRSGVERR